MRSNFGLMFICLFLFSCNDGDLIVTTFNFENATLSLCGDNETQVFYNINNDNINETLSFKTNRSAFGNSTEFIKLILEKNLSAITNDITKTIKIPFNSNNEIIYRTYDGEVTGNYFCNDVPPSSPVVLDEYKSLPGDQDSFLQITTSVLPSDDDDGDTIPNADEGKDSNQDTDDDGIPDYLDTDDDGDNVPTKSEIDADVNEPVDDNGNLDTDQDGIPNYLDADDDGDGVLSKLEITTEEQLPTANKNEGGIPKYLDKFSKDKFDGTPNTITNTITVKYISTLTAKNIKFKKQADNGEEISYTTFQLGNFTSSGIPTIISPTNTEEPTPNTTN